MTSFECSAANNKHIDKYVIKFKSFRQDLIEKNLPENNSKNFSTP